MPANWGRYLRLIGAFNACRAGFPRRRFDGDGNRRARRAASDDAGGPRYRLSYGRPGKRIVGYDSEQPKGDHKHIESKEHIYRFKDVDTLVRDLLADVNRYRANTRRSA